MQPTDPLPLQHPSIDLDMQNALSEIKVFGMPKFQMRIGIHSGPVVAGVIGEKKFTYDLWGESVNIASRMEQQADPGTIHVSETVYERLKTKFSFETRGEIDVKDIGKMKTYFLTGKK